MSLKIKTPLRLKALFAGVALSKKTVDAISDHLAKAGLTDEATDEEIDAKLNERNALYPFEDQKKFDDYQIGKANKEAADKETKRLADIAAGKDPEIEVDPNETKTDKMLRLLMEKLDKQEQTIAAFGQEKVTNTRKDALLKTLEGLPETFRELKLESFEGKSFKDDEDFNSFIEKTKTQSAGFVQEESNSSLGGDRPTGGTGKQVGTPKVISETDLDEIMNNI